MDELLLLVVGGGYNCHCHEGSNGGGIVGSRCVLHLQIMINNNDADCVLYYAYNVNRATLPR